MSLKKIGLLSLLSIICFHVVAKEKSDYSFDEGLEIIKLSLVSFNNSYPMTYKGMVVSEAAMAKSSNLMVKPDNVKIAKDNQFATINQNVELTGTFLDTVRKLGVTNASKRLGYMNGCQIRNHLESSFKDYGFDLESLPAQLVIRINVLEDGNDAPTVKYVLEDDADCSTAAIKKKQKPTTIELLHREVVALNSTLPNKVNESTVVKEALLDKRRFADGYFFNIRTQLPQITFGGEQEANIRRHLVNEAPAIICQWKKTFQSSLKSRLASGEKLDYATRMIYEDKDGREIIIMNEEADEECEAALK